jgi:hypothetical protein
VTEAEMPQAQRMAIAVALAVALLCLVYAVVLTIGLLTLPSPQHQIQDPWFSLLEVLIIVIAPVMVGLTVALHARAEPHHKPFAIASTTFMAMCAVVTCSVHFSTLTLSRQPSFVGQDWARNVFAFQWPSVAYALDILAWDIFFPLAALFAAPTIQGMGQAGVARRLMYTSSALAFIGLAGVPLSNMQVRNIGIVGYAVLFPVAAALLAGVFSRHWPTRAASSDESDRLG